MDENIFVQYKNDEERQSAFRKMVGLRQEFESQVNKIIAKRHTIQTVQ